MKNEKNDQNKLFSETMNTNMKKKKNTVGKIQFWANTDIYKLSIKFKTTVFTSAYFVILISISMTF